MAGAAIAFARLPHFTFFPPKSPNVNSSNLRSVSGVAECRHPVAKIASSSALHKWRMVIAYDGTNFSGWQYQESPPTVQCIIEKALMRITKLDRKELCLVGASRTDTGVHAWGQMAHFVTPFFDESLESIHAAVNGLLPDDIRVREISPARPEFHARFSTKSKTYHYKIYNNAIMDPFQCRYAYHSAYKLNPLPMREAARYFVGRHDFSSFANASHNDRSPDPVKEIFHCDVTEMGPILQLEVEGSGFLFRQVRNMAALLLQIGREALPPNILPKILAARDRRELAKYALSAPPHGLCLICVNYSEEALRPPAGYPAASFGRAVASSPCDSRIIQVILDSPLRASDKELHPVMKPELNHSWHGEMIRSALLGGAWRLRSFLHPK